MHECMCVCECVCARVWGIIGKLPFPHHLLPKTRLTCMYILIKHLLPRGSHAQVVNGWGMESGNEPRLG